MQVYDASIKYDFFFSDLEDSLPDAMKEMFDMEFDFPPRTHCLSRWYYALENYYLLPKYKIPCMERLLL